MLRWYPYLPLPVCVVFGNVKLVMLLLLFWCSSRMCGASLMDLIGVMNIFSLLTSTRVTRTCRQALRPLRLPWSRGLESIFTFFFLFLQLLQQLQMSQINIFGIGAHNAVLSKDVNQYSKHKVLVNHYPSHIRGCICRLKIPLGRIGFLSLARSFAIHLSSTTLCPGIHMKCTFYRLFRSFGYLW